MNRQSNKITALYCRIAHYHSEMDALAARNQMERLTAYAAKNGLQNPKFFCDWGFSGTTTGRPEYQRMLWAVEAGNVSDLVVMSLSRLCRDFMACQELLERVLPQAGVTLHSLQEQAIFPQKDIQAEVAHYHKLLALIHQERQNGGRK